MTRCTRCSGNLFPDVDGGSSCMWCGEVVYGPDVYMETLLGEMARSATNDRRARETERYNAYMRDYMKKRRQAKAHGP
jgi:hypothetical protein